MIFIYSVGTYIKKILGDQYVHIFFTKNIYFLMQDKTVVMKFKKNNNIREFKEKKNVIKTFVYCSPLNLHSDF